MYILHHFFRGCPSCTQLRGRFSLKLLIVVLVVFALGCESTGVSDGEMRVGREFVKAGKFEEAIAHFTKGLEKSPRSADLLLERGLAYEESGKLTAAVQDYEEVLKLRPRHVSAHAILANAYRRLGRIDDAVKLLRAATELSPGEGWLRNLRGKLEAQAGDIRGAQSSLELAVRLEPNDHEFRRDLGAFYEAQGDVESALREYRRVLELLEGLPKFAQEAKEMRDRVARLSEGTHPGSRP